MTFFKKILGAAVVATLAMSVVATSASAHNPQNYKGPGILPALAGPVGAAALFPATNTFSWFTHSTVFSHKNYFVKIFHNWHQIPKSTYYDLVKLNHKLPGTHFDVPIKKDKVYKEVKTKHSRSNKTVGKAVVGCIFGSALAVITASVRKASAMGNPPRWRSQAEHEKIVASGYEKQFELTNDEASTAAALCGLGSFALHWQQKAPVVVKARY